MLSPTDVRTGNWVLKIVGTDKNRDSFLEYRSIALDEYYYTSALACFPIALTPVILKYCGFKQVSGDWHKSIEEKGKERGLPLLMYKNEKKTWYFGDFKIPAQPQYVHQLQNLYYALTGQELVVTLGFYRNLPLFGPIDFFRPLQNNGVNPELL
jgi:hypothetical protein